MKFLVTSISFDITVHDTQLTDPSNLSRIGHDVICSSDIAYLPCSSIREIEAAYERLRNYQASDDQVTDPVCKIKVLKVEPLPVEDHFRSHQESNSSFSSPSSISSNEPR